MSLADTVRRLVEAGATPEVIAIAVEAIEQAGRKKPRTSAAERQARYRARQSSEADGVTNGVTRDVTRDARSDVTVTDAPSLAPSPQTPQPHTHPRENTPLPPEGRKRRKPETPIPDGCPSAELIDAMQAEAREAGANLDLRHEARQFRDWWQAKDGRNRDWDACWRTWARRAIAKAPKTAAAALAGRPAPAADDRWRRWLREFKRNGYWPSDDAGPRPGRTGCRAPAAILAEFGITPPAANDTPLFGGEAVA